MKYSKELAKLIKEQDLIKEEIDLVKATLDKKIRTDPEKYGITKITETVVFNTILADEEYQKVIKKSLEKKFEVKTCQGAVNAIEQRKSMLEALIKLHGQQYFAGPSVPHDLTELREQKREELKQRKGTMTRSRNK
jgi:hypothetical protein